MRTRLLHLRLFEAFGSAIECRSSDLSNSSKTSRSGAHLIFESNPVGNFF